MATNAPATASALAASMPVTLTSTRVEAASTDKKMFSIGAFVKSATRARIKRTTDGEKYATGSGSTSDMRTAFTTATPDGGGGGTLAPLTTGRGTPPATSTPPAIAPPKITVARPKAHHARTLRRDRGATGGGRTLAPRSGGCATFARTKGAATSLYCTGVPPVATNTVACESSLCVTGRFTPTDCRLAHLALCTRALYRSVLIL